jgi:cysteine-rich repeat protein
MRGKPVSLVRGASGPLLAVAIGWATACGSQDTAPAAPSPGDGADASTPDAGEASGGAGARDAGTRRGTGGAGLAGAGAGGASGAAGSGGSDAGTPGGADAAAPASKCGDGVRTGGEFCDGTDLHGADCTVFGYVGGDLGCSAGCSYDFARCTGKAELCYDGIDNDGNRKKDCADPACAATCADSCSAPPRILDPGFLNGDSTGHASLLTSSCLPSGATSGPELVFRVVASQTGVLEAVLTAVSADFSLSVRTDCAAASAEKACSDRSAGPGATETVKIPVTAGDPLFLVVDGAGPGDVGAFALEVHSSAIACGNRTRDPGEECDDGNTTSGDGCSGTCKLELSEHEPNDTLAAANAYTHMPFVAQISPAGDVDVFSITLKNANSQIDVDTLDLGDGACANLELDDRVDLLGPDGHVIASNDDGNVGFCATLSATGLAAGTYYVRVTASGVATTFPYMLAVHRSP